MTKLLQTLLTTILLTTTLTTCTPKTTLKNNNTTTFQLQRQPSPSARQVQLQYLAPNPNAKSILLISGDEEYRSEEALPQLAKILSQHHGFNCTVLFAQDPKHPGIVNPNYSSNIPGLEQLAKADLMILFTRFRALPDEQMKHIDDYLKSGKPVLGIRTATHAFRYKTEQQSNYKHYGNYYAADDEWKDGFGRLVMGEHWIAHHGRHAHQSTKGLLAPGAENNPIAQGIANGDIWGPTDVYGVRLPLPGDAQPIILGQVTDRSGAYDENDPLLGMRPSDDKIPAPSIQKDESGKERAFDPNAPMMPIAWTKTYQLPGGKAGKCFATTIGASTDLLSEGTRRLMVNAVYWTLDMSVPEKAKVELVGPYLPSRFAFYEDGYWVAKGLLISTLE
jgi:Trehalose utilisation